MAKAGLGEGLIVNVIQNQPGSIRWLPMIWSRSSNREFRRPCSQHGDQGIITTAPGGAPVEVGGIPQGIDIGVYFKKGGKWEEMLPEVVNWKTGGIVKSIASVGLVKGDINGHIEGANSRNSTTSPLEILVYARRELQLRNTSSFICADTMTRENSAQ